VYSSPADVRNALTPGADEADQTTAASFSDAQITDGIKEADGMIDTYLSGRFGIPTDPTATPPNSVAVYPVRAWSRDIAAYLVTLTYRKSKDLQPDDPVRLRFLWVIGVLEKIAAGDLTPNLPQPPALPDGYGPQGAFVYNQYHGKLFTMADVFCPPGHYSRYPWLQYYRYGDILRSDVALALAGSGFNEVLVLVEGQPIPAGTPEDTLVVFVPEGS
jgi:phage gp36-like protein